MKIRLGAGISSIRGKIGSLCGKTTSHGVLLTEKSIPGSVTLVVPTRAQRAAKARYAIATGRWLSASPSQKATWNFLGAQQKISGFNYLVMTMVLNQDDVEPDVVEASTMDTQINSLLSNLNRIRNQIASVTGESWGTVSHSISAVWSKFNATSGHKHSGDPDDGAVIDHGALSGLSDDDHTRYFDKDCRKSLSGWLLNRDVNDSQLALFGGDVATQVSAGLYCYGGSHPSRGGCFDLYVPNASLDAYILAFSILGNVDAPSPSFAGLTKGSTSISDGGTITHSCGATPTAVVVSGTIANEIVSVTAKGATTFTVAIKKRSDGSAGTSQTIHWIAWL